MADVQVPSLKTLLVQLAGAAAISGREEGVAAVVLERLREAGIPCRRDALGNLYANVPSTRAESDAASRSPLQPLRRPTLILSAHMDTIGLVVREVEESGAIRILPVGGVNRRTLLAQEVWVHGRERLFGVVGTTPPHLMTAAERKQIPPWEQFFVDTGLSGKELARRVQPGDWISFAASPAELMHERVTSPGLDNRAGVVAVLWAGLTLAASGEELPLDVTLLFTVQEELGLRGAGAFAEWLMDGAPPFEDEALPPKHEALPPMREVLPSARAALPSKPDAPSPERAVAAIVVDVGFGDMPGVRPRDSIGFGKGPALTLGPNIHKEARRFLVSVAKREGIPVQDEVMAGSSGTDAWALQVAWLGIPCAVVSIPLRSMHSTVETVDMTDLEHAANLLVAACRQAVPSDAGGMGVGEGVGDAARQGMGSDDIRRWSGGIVARKAE